MSTTKIEKKLNSLKERERITTRTIKQIVEFWEDNKEEIGRKLGDFTLKCVKYSNAYSGMYKNVILFQDEKILGEGYEGYAQGHDYNTYSFQCASRDIHIKFFREFERLLLEKLDNNKKKEKILNSFKFKRV